MKPNTPLHPQKFLDLYEDMFETLSEGYTINNLLFANMNLWIVLMLFVHQEIDKKLTIKGMAAIVSFSPSNLYNQFKSQTGYSPLDYFIH